jgi:hypothetical protein
MRKHRAALYNALPNRSQDIQHHIMFRQISPKIFLLATILSMVLPSNANELKPFTTDGCSLWMDGPPLYPNLWRHCCVAHDLAYWQGGSKEQRLAADNAIHSCVFQAADSKGMANYMHGMIRWGGSPYWMTYYRWSYGWDYWEGMKPRGYKVPTVEEQQKINQLLPDAIQLMVDDAKKYPPEKMVEKLRDAMKQE